MNIVCFMYWNNYWTPGFDIIKNLYTRERSLSHPIAAPTNTEWIFIDENKTHLSVQTASNTLLLIPPLDFRVSSFCRSRKKHLSPRNPSTPRHRDFARVFPRLIADSLVFSRFSKPAHTVSLFLFQQKKNFSTPKRIEQAHVRSRPN